MRLARQYVAAYGVNHYLFALGTFTMQYVGTLASVLRIILHDFVRSTYVSLQTRDGAPPGRWAGGGRGRESSHAWVISPTYCHHHGNQVSGKNLHHNTSNMSIKVSWSRAFPDFSFRLAFCTLSGSWPIYFGSWPCFLLLSLWPPWAELPSAGHASRSFFCCTQISEGSEPSKICICLLLSHFQLQWTIK